MREEREREGAVHYRVSTVFSVCRSVCILYRSTRPSLGEVLNDLRTQQRHPITHSQHPGPRAKRPACEPHRSTLAMQLP